MNGTRIAAFEIDRVTADFARIVDDGPPSVLAATRIGSVRYRDGTVSPTTRGPGDIDAFGAIEALPL